MIISCPECAGPFEVPDDQIAALVQVQCPHCSFRMILDFAAANDPGLVEQGMRMASGFRSAADYRASQQPARPVEAVPEPEVAAPVPEPVAPTPEPEVAAPTPEPRVATPQPARPRPRVTAPTPEPRRPTAAPPREPARPVAPPREAAPPPRPEPARPVPTPGVPPVRRRIETDEDLQVRVSPPAEEVAVRAPERAVDEEALTVAPPGRGAPPVRPPVRTPPARPPAEPPPARGGTVVTPAPSAADRAAHPSFDEDEEAPTVMVPPEAREAARREMEAQRRAAARPEPEPDDLDVDVEEEDEDEAAPVDRAPPHTPPRKAKPSRGAEDDEAAEAEPKPRRKKPRLEALDDLEQEVPQKGMSTLGVVAVVVLLLMSLGLVGASLALEDSVDPRPLLEKLYRQYVKGE